MFFSFLNLSQTSSTVYKMLFFPTVHFSVEDPFFNHKNTDSSHLYNLWNWVQLFSGRTNCGVTASYCRQFSIQRSKSTRHSLCTGMQVDTKCVKWRNVMLWKSLPFKFSHTPEQVTHTGVSSLTPLCLPADWILMFPAAQPKRPISLPLISLFVSFFFFTVFLHRSVAHVWRRLTPR